MLQSGASAAPAWSTATWPATTSINRILYSSAANTVSEITTAANGVLLTDVTGVPSIGTTLPSTVQTNITALGVVATGTWNATAITVPHGGTGNTTFTAFSVICAGTTATGTFQNVSGVGLLGQFLMSNGAGALPSWANVSGSGTVNSGNANEIAYYAAGGTTVSGLTTANGGVLVTSNTGQPSILVGSGTTGTILQATSGAAPAWSTATYPATTTINQLLYSSSANVIAGVTSANSGAVVTTSAGVPTIIAAGTTGQVLQASTAGTPAWSTPTYPTTSGTARKILVSDATNNVYSTETWAVPGSANNTLVSNGTNWIALATNPVIQQVRTISGSVATGSTTLPIDNTIPQSGEGDQYLTLAITPKNTANVLKIDISMFFARATTAGNTAVALFQDSTANALAAGMFNSAISIASECGFTYYMAAGTTSATTFKVRAGNGLGNTTTFNGNAGSAFMGGVLASTIIITEYAL
jgi:hypothetical protein